MNKIVSFWNWFLANEAELKLGKIDGHLIMELENQLHKIDMYAWAIRPDPSSEANRCFAIPINLDAMYARRVDNIINCAPEIEGWTFRAGLGRVSWEYKIMWGPTLELVDATQWKFQLRRYPDNLHDVVLHAETLPKFQKEDLEDLIYQVVEYELGQRLMLDTVYSVDFVLVEDIHKIENLISIKDIYEFLNRSFENRVIH